MFEKIIGLLFLILGLGLFLLLSFIGYDNQKINLEDFTKYESIVTKKGVGIESKVFYLKMNGLEKKIGVYRMFRNYDKLLQDIEVGDQLKIYYKPNENKNENINIDVIQIERGNKIIVNKSEYQTKYRILMAVGIIASLAMIMMIISLLKYGKVESIIPPIF